MGAGTCSTGDGAPHCTYDWLPENSDCSIGGEAGKCECSGYAGCTYSSAKRCVTEKLRQTGTHVYGPTSVADAPADGTGCNDECFEDDV